MAEKRWEQIKVRTCDRIGKEVTLDAELIYPADFMPDQPPRILAHRCSKGMECNQMNAPTCIWSGTLPGYDPFA